MKGSARLLMGLMVMLMLAVPVSAKDLVVAHDTNFMPFEFKGPDGKFTGFDIELWQQLAKIVGVSYTFQPMDFNGIIPGLQTGNVDVGIAGMTITPERAKVVKFSDGYYTSGLAILVREDEKQITKLEDLAGKNVAVKTGTSSVPFMTKFGKAKELKHFPNNDGMFFELLSKGVDAVLFDAPVVSQFATTAGKGKAKVVGPLY
ncbi:MAG: transporter substrate-binding domain-containing protein, partial [Bilophila sp.]